MAGGLLFVCPGAYRIGDALPFEVMHPVGKQGSGHHY